jgi:hypothetical protein
MTVTRYKLEGNTTAYATGSKTLGATSISTYPTVPAPPTGLASSAEMAAGAKLENATYPNPTDGSGEWFDVYFVKAAGVSVTIGTFACSAWGYAGETLSITAAGGAGVHLAGTSVPVLSGMNASPRIADSTFTADTWHRVRLEFPTTGTATAKFFIGSNRHGTTPDATMTGLWDFSDYGTYGTVYWAYANGVSGSTTQFSDVAYGLYADTPPARSATDWAVVTHTAAAAASETATGTSAAVSTRLAAAAPSITATGAATGGLLVTAAAAPSITAAGSADASIITTHNAEAAGIVTVSTADAMTMLRSMEAVSTITATGSGTAALDGGADAVVQAIGAASIRIDGETSPGFLYATVSKHILTN